MPRVSAFLTDLGWFGLAGDDGRVEALTIGHAGKDAALEAAAERLDTHEALVEQDWQPGLRRRLEDYARGRPVTFDDVDVRDRSRTEFQRQVVEVVRGIPAGETRSYGEVARLAGRPGAARAVGNVMASNRLPILVPCHRVVAANAALGGFSAPQGVALKERMLALEAEAALV